MDEEVLSTQGLTKEYGNHKVLNNFSLTAMKSDIYGLIGRNGAGKTTLFKCILGLIKPSGGSVIINGKSKGLPAQRRHIGFMINPSFFPYLSAAENLNYLCRVRGNAQKGEAARVLKLVGLTDDGKPCRDFSMGMKQRLGIAGALLGSPPIVMLDEPINGLDPQGIADIRGIIRDVHLQSGASFIISSHILAELDLVASRFGFIEQGVLLKEISRDCLHKETEKDLRVEVDDARKAADVLKLLGMDATVSGEKSLSLPLHADRSNDVARALVRSGVEVYDLHRKETTLEEYFISLTGGEQNA